MKALQRIESGSLIREADVDVVLVDGRRTKVHVKAIYTGSGTEPLRLIYTVVEGLTKQKRLGGSKA